MQDENKTREQLLDELRGMKQRVAEAEARESKIRDAEKALRSSSEQQTGFLATVLESLTHPFYVIDADNYTVVMANGASRFDLSHGERTCYALTHRQNEPCNTSEHPCPVKEVKKTGKAVTVEHVHYNNDDGERHVELHAHPIFDGQGKVVQVLEYCLDITERKRAEEALRVALARLEGLLNATPDLVFFKDVEGRYLIVNDAAQDFFGLPKEEIEGKVFSELLPPNLSELSAKDDEMVLRTRVPVEGEQFITAEDWVTRENWASKWYDTIKFPIIDQAGQVLGIGGISRDVTQRKRVEEELKDSEKRNRLLIDESPVGISILQHGKVVYVNPAVMKIFGLESADRFIGTPVEQFVVPSQRETVRQRHTDRAAGRPAPLHYEATGLKPNGETVDVAVWPRRTVYQGEPAIFVFTADMSEFKALQAQLLHARKMEAIGTLAAGIAHEFNNLLTVSSGYTELLLAEKGERDPDYSDLQKIAASCARGAELVKKLRLLGRRADCQFRTLDLNRELSETVELLSRTLPANIALDLHLDNSLRKIRADSSQVTQMIINLVVNAADAMPEGGKLRIETKACIGDQEPCGAPPEANPQDYVQLSISDTGHGMDGETRSRIFEPFFTTRGLANRSGLGLAVVHGIVEEHGGHVFCESEVGGGTIFKIDLPATTEPTRLESFKTGAGVQGGTETVLLVEDEDLVTALLSKVLTRAGYRVLTASDGQEALELYGKERQSISLVILDLVMPKMGGRECLAQLLKIDPEVKILIVTGYSDNARRDELMEAGARGFISKPFEMGQLLKTVRDVLSHSSELIESKC